MTTGEEYGRRLFIEKRGRKCRRKTPSFKPAVLTLFHFGGHRLALVAGRQAWSRGALTPAVGNPMHLSA